MHCSLNEEIEMNQIPEVPFNENGLDDNQFRRLVDSIEDYAIFILDINGRVISRATPERK